MFSQINTWGSHNYQEFRHQYSIDIASAFTGQTSVGDVVEKVSSYLDQLPSENLPIKKGFNDTFSQNVIAFRALFDQYYDAINDQNAWLFALRTSEQVKQVEDDVVKQINLYLPKNKKIEPSLSELKRYRYTKQDVHDALDAFMALNLEDFDLNKFLLESFKSDTVFHCKLKHALSVQNFCEEVLEENLRAYFEEHFPITVKFFDSHEPVSFLESCNLETLNEELSSLIDFNLASILLSSFIQSEEIKKFFSSEQLKSAQIDVQKKILKAVEAKAAKLKAEKSVLETHLQESEAKALDLEVEKADLETHFQESEAKASVLAAENAGLVMHFQQKQDRSDALKKETDSLAQNVFKLNHDLDGINKAITDSENDVARLMKKLRQTNSSIPEEVSKVFPLNPLHNIQKQERFDKQRTDKVKIKYLGASSENNHDAFSSEGSQQSRSNPTDQLQAIIKLNSDLQKRKAALENELRETREKYHSIQLQLTPYQSIIYQIQQLINSLGLAAKKEYSQSIQAFQESFINANQVEVGTLEALNKIGHPFEISHLLKDENAYTLVALLLQSTGVYEEIFEEDEKRILDSLLTQISSYFKDVLIAKKKANDSRCRFIANKLEIPCAISAYEAAILSGNVLNVKDFNDARNSLKDILKTDIIKNLVDALLDEVISLSIQSVAEPKEETVQPQLVKEGSHV